MHIYVLTQNFSFFADLAKLRLVVLTLEQKLWDLGQIYGYFVESLFLTILTKLLKPYKQN